MRQIVAPPDDRATGGASRGAATALASGAGSSGTSAASGDAGVAVASALALAGPSGTAGPPERWRTAAEAAGILPFGPSDRATIDLGDGATLRLLAPTADLLAVEIALGPTRVLLVGAADQESQAELADALDDPVDVLWLGAAASLDPLLRERADPRLLVQHVRPFPRRGAPPADDRLRVLRSDDHGTVELTLRADGYDIRARR